MAIRDAILQLRPYFRDLDPTWLAECNGRIAILPTQRRHAEQALQLADALYARAAGDPPASVEEAAKPITLKRSADLEEETAEMLRLARWWNRAKVTAARKRSAAAADSHHHLTEPTNTLHATT